MCSQITLQWEVKRNRWGQMKNSVQKKRKSKLDTNLKAPTAPTVHSVQTAPRSAKGEDLKG